MTNDGRLYLSRLGTFISILLLASLAHAQVSPSAVRDEIGAEKPAESLSPDVPTDFASPRDTISTFLLNMAQLAEDHDNEAAWKQVYRTLDAPETLAEKRRTMAVELLGVFNSLGRIDVETMAPGSEEIKEKKLKRFEFLPNNPYPAAKRLIRKAVLDLGSEPPGKTVLVMTEAGEWKFSADTLDSLGKVWSWIEKRGARHGVDVRELDPTQMIRTHLVPEILKGRFILGVELWQWIGLLVALFGAVLVDFLIRLMLRPIVRWIFYKSTGEAERDSVRTTVRPFGLLVSVLVFWWFLNVLGLIGVALLVLVVAAKLVFGFAAAWATWSITDLVAGAFQRKSEATQMSIDNMLVPLVRRAVKLLIFAFALIYTAHALDINILPLLGSVGLAGLAISFAAQDLIRNLFGGMTIFLDKPFKTGDRILYQNYDGIIESIGFRSTKVRKLNGHLVSIPNGGLTGDAVENISSRPSIRRIMNITLPLSTSRQKLSQAIKIIRDILEEEGVRERIHPVINGEVFNPRVYFNNFNVDSLNLFVIYWFAPPDYWDFMDNGERLNMRIVEDFESAGIEFALPVRKLQLASGEPSPDSLFSTLYAKEKEFAGKS